MYLLDTMVPSELRQGVRASPALTRWVDSVDQSSLYLSVITILEMRFGAVKRQRKDPTQAAIFHRWLDGSVLALFAGRILPVTQEVVERCAWLYLNLPTRKLDNDTLIAATALVHNLTVVTRNTSHFEDTGVRLLNPWQ